VGAKGRHDGGPVGSAPWQHQRQVARRCIPVDMGVDEVRNSLCGGTEVREASRPSPSGAGGNATIGSAPGLVGKRR
jgi:hypothetical protein